jgi:hypothetical protein
MNDSAAVREAWLRFCDRLSAGDVASFDDVVSGHPATTVIGTAPDEIVTERAQLRYGFEAEGLTLEPAAPAAYEQGDLGWAMDEPSFVFPDGSRVKLRTTLVFRREEEVWKLLHMHASVGVPDEEVVELQQRWGTGGG